METKTEGSASPPSVERPRRVIKRYSNRKLYDTKDSRYVTLLQIAEMVRAGEEVQIVDNNSKEDLTQMTLAQIIYEEQKAHSRSVPLQTLKELIHQRTERVLEGLREGPIGRLIPGGAKPGGEEGPPPPSTTKKSEPPKPGLVDQAKEKLDDLGHTLDERVRAILASFRPLQQLQAEVKRLGERLEELERKLKGPPPGNSGGPPSAR